MPVTSDHAPTVRPLYSPLRSDACALLDRLTERQAEVLDRAAVPGRPSNKHIARDMGISPAMVDKHMQRARAKLNAATRQEAIVRYAVAKAVVSDGGSGSGYLQIDPAIVEKALREMPGADALELLSSPEFEQFLVDLRSNGPKAWTAKYGRGWILVAIPIVALAILVIFGALGNASVWIASFLDGVFTS